MNVDRRLLVVSLLVAGELAATSDLLQHLLDKGHRPDNGVRTNTRDILDQLSELTLAGAETTSATIWYVPFL
jgi:cytochrome P450